MLIKLMNYIIKSLKKEVCRKEIVVVVKISQCDCCRSIENVQSVDLFISRVYHSVEGSHNKIEKLDLCPLCLLAYLKRFQTELKRDFSPIIGALNKELYREFNKLN